jgi:response regulator RpfG family c-di-GMP phosphodiesterase
MEPRVLFVDDEANILNAFKRQLRGSFAIDTAPNGQAGLEMLEKFAGYSVIASDMHMPGMNGIDFLQKAHSKAPESVGLMLTGDHDQDLAVKAINEGQIFRFLNKPCSMDDLTKVLNACVAQHNLITAEHELLQKTLGGSVKVLTDILSISDPHSFGQGLNLRSLIRELVPRLGIRNTWDIELAAMLANIGTIVIPETVLSKSHKGATLNADELQIISSIPQKGRDLLSNIPRLEQVAKIVYYQNKNFDGSGFPQDATSGDKIPIGARVIRILRDLNELEVVGMTRPQAFKQLQQIQGSYDRSIVDRLLEMEQQQTPVPELEKTSFSIHVNQLCPGQVLLAPVETVEGVLLLARGGIVTSMLIDRIMNYHRFVGIKEPLLVNAMTPIINSEEK